VGSPTLIGPVGKKYGDTRCAAVGAECSIGGLLPWAEVPVNYDEFVSNVSVRADVSFEKAQALTRATLEALADRISGGEARQLAELLPEPLNQWLSSGDEIAQRLPLHSFVVRVAEQAGLDEDDAELGIRAVVTTLREAVGDKELRDATAQLPKSYDVLLEGPVGRPGRRHSS
jgi:uncharacterized protein (DUF2267 family)